MGFDEKWFNPTMDYVTRMLGVFFGVIFNELINKSCAGYKSSHGGM